MYTLCRSQFLPCALIMAALTAGIFMLFYCLRKKPMWVTACVLLLIVGAVFTSKRGNGALFFKAHQLNCPNRK